MAHCSVPPAQDEKDAGDYREKTPEYQHPLLRNELGGQRIELGELVILGASAKLANLRAERDERSALRRRAADRIRERRPLPIDTSAWTRFGEESLPASRAIEISDDYEAGRLAVCVPFLLEAGYSARGARGHAEIVAELKTLPLIPIDRDTERRALDAQAQLARAGHHRMPPIDVLLGAIADRHGLGILHYDNDFEVLLERTDLVFPSVWLMPRGSL